MRYYGMQRPNRRRHWTYVPTSWWWMMHSVVFATLCSCGPGLAPGYRALTLGARIGGRVEAQLGSECNARRLACEAKHPVGDLRVACELPCLRALRTWAAARVTYNAAAETTWGELEVARLASKDAADWIGMLRAGMCALLKVGAELRPILGAGVSELLAPIVAIHGLTCGGVP